jgi:hypothetical protein
VHALPVEMSFLMGTALSAVNASALLGSTHSCVITTSRDVKCIGFNAYGQTDVPSSMHGSAVYVCAGSRHTCALVQSGASTSSTCWGDTDAGISVSNARQLSCGDSHTCALMNDGTVVCSGSNLQSQLEVPADIVNATSLSAGWFHTCALVQGVSTASVKCWGDDTHKQLAPSFNMSAIVSVMSGNAYSCSGNTSGDVLCWGNENPTSSPIPMASRSASHSPTHSFGYSQSTTHSAAATAAVTPSTVATAAITPSAAVTAAITSSAAATATTTISAAATSPPSTSYCYNAPIPFNTASGFPAVAVILQCPSGQTFSHVSWASYGVFDGGCANYWDSSTSVSQYDAGTLSNSARCSNEDVLTVFSNACTYAVASASCYYSSGMLCNVNIRTPGVCCYLCQCMPGVVAIFLSVCGKSCGAAVTTITDPCSYNQQDTKLLGEQELLL